MFFGFTHCPDVCPTALFEISEIMRELGSDGDRMRAMFVTVDPERDTPEKLKDYLSSFDPRLIGATGDEAAIKAVEKAYRVYAKRVPLDGGGYTMDHTAIVYLMDKERPLRRAVQHEAPARRGGGRSAPVHVNARGGTIKGAAGRAAQAVSFGAVDDRSVCLSVRHSRQPPAPQAR